MILPMRAIVYDPRFISDEADRTPSGLERIEAWHVAELKEHGWELVDYGYRSPAEARTAWDDTPGIWWTNDGGSKPTLKLE